MKLNNLLGAFLLSTTMVACAQNGVLVYTSSGGVGISLDVQVDTRTPRVRAGSYSGDATVFSTVTEGGAVIQDTYEERYDNGEIRIKAAAVPGTCSGFSSDAAGTSNGAGLNNGRFFATGLACMDAALTSVIAEADGN